MDYICPFCTKTSHLPDIGAKLANWQIECAHCKALSEPEILDKSATLPHKSAPPDKPAYHGPAYHCPTCHQALRIPRNDEAAIASLVILCPICRTSLRFVPSSANHISLFTKCAFLCVLAISGLWLALTPHGSWLIRQAASLLPQSRDYLFQANHALYDFLAFLQGLFL